MAENGAEKPDVKKEQGRLDAIDKNDDKQVMVDGKDYGDIVLKKVDATIAKIENNTGVKDPRILETKSFKAIKERSKQDIAEKLSKIDEKNIKAEAAKLEATLKEIEADFDKVKQYEYSYFEISDRFADRLNTTSQSLTPLLEQIKALQEKEDIAIDLKELGIADVRVGDSFVIKHEHTKKELQRITLKRIDPEGKQITVTYNGDEKNVGTFSSPEHLANSISSSQQAYKRDLYNARNKMSPIVPDAKLSYEKRVVKTTQNVELQGKIEAAQKLMQEQGVLGLQQFVVDANQDIPFGEDIKAYGTLAGMFKEGSLGLQGGKIIFDAKFDQYDASFRADKIKQLKTYLEDTATKANVESEKNPDKKMMRQAEFALKQGNIKEARILAINFLEEMKMDPAKLTDEMKCEKARALGIVESVYKGAVQKLQAANERVFGKSALEAMRGVKKYNSMVPGSDGGMAIYEKAFGFMRAKNEKIAAELMKTQSEDDLMTDPAEAYANAKSAAPDVPENLRIFASQGSKTEQVRAAVTDCEQIWNKVASAETSFMQTQDKNQEKGKFIDAIQALRTIGETDNASLYVAEGFRDSMDTVKNANPEAIAKRKQEMIIGIQKNKPSYIKRIEDQLRKDAEAKGERSPDVSQEALNKLVDQSIEKAADEQMQNTMLKDIAVSARMGKGDFYQGKDKEMADLYVKMKNPEGKWLVFSDDDYVQLGDNVIKIALEALVIGVSGGVGSIVASGARLGVSALGGSELLGQAIAVVAEAGAFEATNKLIAPHITGGPGFTTAGAFAMDWARSIALFSALKASGEYVKNVQQAGAIRAGEKMGFQEGAGALEMGMQGMKTGTKIANWGAALGMEAASMTAVSTIEEMALNEHWDPRDMGVAFANNIKMIIGLRMGSKLVHPLTAPLHEAASMIEGKNAEVRAKQEEAKREVAVSKTELEQKTSINIEGAQKRIEALSGENIHAEIDRINSEMGEHGFKGNELRVIRSAKEGIVYVDQNGKLTLVQVQKGNAKDVLRDIKKIDAALKGNSYGLRQEIIARSEGTVKTEDAFTYGEVPSGGKEFDNFLDDPNNWLPERRVLHERLLNAELEKAQQLSARLNDSEPTAYLMRGNTASGKTTRLKSDPGFQRAADSNGEVTGAVNPDNIKALLRQHDQQGGSSENSSQVHFEGSMLAIKLTKQIEGAVQANGNGGETGLSYVIDRRLDKASLVDSYLEQAERSGRKVKILDIDAPLESSCQRVLNRAIGGADPAVPFNAVAQGFEGVRSNRAALLSRVAHDPAITDYVLYGTNAAGETIKIAEKKDGGKLQILDVQLTRELMHNKGIKAEIERIGGQAIDDAYIARADARVKQALERYKGKTLKQALDEHSSRLQ